MAGILTLGMWLGGPDDVKVESTFPSTVKTYAYNFARSVSGWDFKLDYQTVVVDTISYDRNTGAPNFANSQVIGYFPGGTVSTATYINVVSTSSGIINVTHPAALYTGAILPDARANSPLLVMSFTWSDNMVPAQVNTHRMAKILAWEPEVTPNNPINSAGFVSLL
jgi:hypothetical protein